MTRDTYKQQAKTARVIARQIAKTEHERKFITSQLMATIMIFGGKITAFEGGPKQ
jgi:hypothetical protein